MVSCDVIADLLVVYAAGEASADTRALVEAHLPGCPDCQAALARATAAEAAVDALPPAPRPANGALFLARLRRVLYVIVIGSLLSAALALALATRFVFALFRLPLPDWRLAGSGLAWLGGGLAALAAYALLLRRAGSGLSLLRAALLALAGLTAFKVMSDAALPGVAAAGGALLALCLAVMTWRARQPAAPRREFLLSLEAAVPLAALTVSAAYVVGARPLPEPILAAGLLLAALVGVFAVLPRLPYFALLTSLSVALAMGLLLAHPAQLALAVLDLPPQLPAVLGHPAPGAVAAGLPADAPSLDLVAERAVTEVWGVGLPEGAQAHQGDYAGPFGAGRLTVLEFASVAEAYDFMDDFRDALPRGERLFDIDLDLQNTVLTAGRLSRGYDTTSELAHSAWQTSRWVVIAEGEGGLVPAVRVARILKDAAAALYAAQR